MDKGLILAPLSFRAFKLILAVSLLTAAPAAAQQEISGVAGSPRATIFPNSKIVPPPGMKFGGVIKQNAAQSKDWWAPRVVPPKGAPNILLTMTDDVGFGAPSTFSGVIPTPSLDRIAANGLRYANFHSTTFCSLTRAGLITGRNHHSVGVGVISEIATGFRGHNCVIGKAPFAFTGKIDKLTIAVERPKLAPEDAKNA